MRIVLLVAASLPARAVAAGPEALDIPSLPLVEAIERLSARTGLSIGGDLQLNPRIRTRAVRGRMSAEAALARMLRGTGLRARRVHARSFRLARIARPAAIAPSPAAEAPEEIVVIASKRALPASLLAGGLDYATFDSPLGERDSRAGPTALVERIPSLSSTALGPGRDKLFLRGIADSSFAGATEATLGEYLGEARINFNAPDPGLLLYDVRRVELLKGAQGTLYGGGTLSGVLRIEPERPDLGRVAGFADAAVSTTRSGGIGNSAAGVLNLPISEGASGLRLLAYRKRDAGYIDDAGRNLRNVNRVGISGGRAQLRVKTGDWQVDIAGTHQQIRSRDSNYAVADLGPLTRATRVAQPSRNRFSLLSVETRGPLAEGELVSTTAIGRNILAATYDGTSRAGSPASFRDERRITTLSNETRLARSSPTGAGWVVGVAASAERDKANQTADTPALADLASSLKSDRLDVALFGQGSLRRGDVLLTAGLRGTYSRQRAKTKLQLVFDELSEGPRGEFNLSPMAEVKWLASERTSVAFSLRQGFRSGGYTIYRVDSGSAAAVLPGFYAIHYDQDLIRTAALELSHRTGGAHPVDLNATLSAVRWNRTQGSVVDEFGFLYSANTNGSTIFNLDLSASWLIRPGLLVHGGIAFTKRSALGPGTAVEEVPSVPDIAAYGSFAWTKPLSGNRALGVEGRLAYRGRSRLGFGFLHDIDQGGALFTSLAVRFTQSRYSVSLSAENLLDDRTSLFGYGNPFTVRTERQTTPQRPRTFSLGVHAAF